MDLNTLTLYSVAAAFSISLSALLMGFAYFQRGTLVAKGFALAILALAVGLLGFGISPVLPRWMIVIGTNMILLFAGVVIYSGFARYCEQGPVTTDRTGWVILLLAAPAFWYWGLIEPDGINRAVVFSVAMATINGRTAVMLIRTARQASGNQPVWVLGILFLVLTAGMIGRAGFLLMAEPPSQDLRGANPTVWITVFWYIVLISLMTVCVVWMEISLRKAVSRDEAPTLDRVFSFVEFFRNKLLFLWVSVIILTFAIFSELGIAYNAIYQSEKARLVAAVTLANDAFVQHTVQVVNQIDTLLHSVRGYYQYARSINDTEAFIDSLGFDHSIIDNVYLLSADGLVVIGHDAAARGRSISDREYYAFHRSNADDQLYISPVESGRVTGKQHFRISRRLNNPDGSFGGIILATVNPDAFASFYRELEGLTTDVSTLIGLADRKLRARVPRPPDGSWLQPIESPVWKALETSPSGLYENNSSIDGIRRVFMYKKVGDLPLVMVTGFSNDRLTAVVEERIRLPLASAMAILIVAYLLAVLLTIEIRRRDEQDRFMSMLSHELKTPMSVIGMSLAIDGLPPGVKARATRAVANMTAIVERCLQSDRLRHGRVRASLTTCHIEKMLEEIRAVSASAHLLVLDAENLPPCNTDPQLLNVILSNLMDNAIKYGAAECPVRITASSDQRKRRSGVRIEIANRPGPAGMPDPRRVFSKYYRGAGAHGKSGSGLGLHIASGFAKTLGGRLDYIPASDEVKFVLWIPA